MRSWSPSARWFLFGWGIAISCQAVRADNPPTDPRLAELERQLRSQQQSLDALERQASAQVTDMDRQRTEQMRAEIRRILNEREFQEQLSSSTVRAGYDKGFFIQSSDQKFELKLNGTMQFRWLYYNAQKENNYTSPRTQRQDRTGFAMQRTRLSFSGFLYDQDFTYKIEIRSDAGDNYDAQLHYAYVNYRFADWFQTRAGLFRFASTPMAMRSDSNLQFVDRSMFDHIFGLGTGFGVRFWGLPFDKKLTYYIDIVNSLATGTSHSYNQVIDTDPLALDTNPAVLGRAVWHVLGDKPNIFDLESDLEIRQDPALDLGVSYAFNHDNGDRITTRLVYPRQSFLPGPFGLTNTNWMEMNQLEADASFKWMGLSFTAQYAVRWLDPTHGIRAPWVQLTGDMGTATQQGGLLQAGYMLPIPGFEKKLEVVARADGVKTEAQRSATTFEYGGGINYYIHGNNVKLQADVTRVTNVPGSSNSASFANANDSVLTFRVQLQVVF